MLVSECEHQGTITKLHILWKFYARSNLLIYIHISRCSHSSINSFMQITNIYECMYVYIRRDGEYVNVWVEFDKFTWTGRLPIIHKNVYFFGKLYMAMRLYLFYIYCAHVQIDFVHANNCIFCVCIACVCVCGVCILMRGKCSHLASSQTVPTQLR